MQDTLCLIYCTSTLTVKEVYKDKNKPKQNKIKN